MLTRVVHKDRAPFDVYIGRGSKWGNPFRIGVDGDRSDVIAKYRTYLAHRPELVADIATLRGKTLGCFCAPKPCHGDVLAALAEHPDIADLLC